MGALVQHCAEADFNATTGECAAPFYSYPESVLPTLSISDAQTIGVALAALWATAWAFRMLRKTLNELA